MALIPSTTYAGQVDPSDPNYPLGKAKNEAVDGDNDGTPLEADWLNDIWGFHQHILAEGGVTADGDPDEVGASQYYEALLAALSGVSFTWTAPHAYAAAVSVEDISVNDVLTLAGPDAEYGSPRQRFMPVPLNTFHSESTSVEVKDSSGAFSVRFVTGAALGVVAFAEVRIPRMSTIVKVHALITSGAAATISMSTTRARFTPGGSTTIGLTALGAPQGSTPNATAWIDTGALSDLAGDGDTLRVEFTSGGFVAADCVVKGVFVEYTIDKATGGI